MPSPIHDPATALTGALLRTHRLDLVAATPAHLEAEIADYAALGRLLGVRVPPGWPPGQYDRDAMRFFRERLLALGDPGAGWFGWYAIARAEGDEDAPTLVGACGYLGPPDAEGGVEIGYSVVEESRGRGYAGEIARAMAAHALSIPGVRHVDAEADAGNEPSNRVLARCGFRVIGDGRDPGHRRWRVERLPPEVEPRDAAVLVPLHRDAGGAWRLVVVRRSEHGIHGGQLAFPGGTRAPADATLFDTALREAGEEIGLPAASVRLVAPLPPVETRVSSFRIAPFLAAIERPAAWRPDPREIAEVLEPPLAELLAPGSRRFATDLMPAAYGSLRLPFYPVGPYRLWGASERILTPLLARLRGGEWAGFGPLPGA